MGQGAPRLADGSTGPTSMANIVSCEQAVGERAAALQRRGGEAAGPAWAGLPLRLPRRGGREGRDLGAGPTERIWPGRARPALSPRPLGWASGGSSLAEDVGRRSAGGFWWRGGRDRGLHQHARLLPSLAAAPSGPAALAPGNAPAPRTPQPGLGTPGGGRLRSPGTRAFSGRSGRSGVSRRRDAGCSPRAADLFSSETVGRWSRARPGGLCSPTTSGAAPGLCVNLPYVFQVFTG